MGNETSLPMDMCSNFDADEIRRLGKRFRKLDLDNSGALSIDEFMSLPELQQNPLVQRVIDIFDADGNGEVDFKEFIQECRSLACAAISCPSCDSPFASTIWTMMATSRTGNSSRCSR